MLLHGLEMFLYSISTLSTIITESSLEDHTMSKIFSENYFYVEKGVFLKSQSASHVLVSLALQLGENMEMVSNTMQYMQHM